MSRAINVNASHANVLSSCRQHGAVISAIEPLRSGGTGVVLMNAQATAIMRQVFGEKVISGEVRRAPLRTYRSRVAGSEQRQADR